MPHRLFYILEALKRGFEFEELLDLSKLAPIYFAGSSQPCRNGKSSRS